MTFPLTARCMEWLRQFRGFDGPSVFENAYRGRICVRVFVGMSVWVVLCKILKKRISYIVSNNKQIPIKFSHASLRRCMPWVHNHDLFAQHAQHVDLWSSSLYCHICIKIFSYLHISRSLAGAHHQRTIRLCTWKIYMRELSSTRALTRIARSRRTSRTRSQHIMAPSLRKKKESSSN